MDGVQDFDSSDLDFSSDDEQQQPGRYKVGQASIDKIIENAENDRISSKKALKALKFQGAAPMTHYASSLWVARFNAFREQALRQSTDTPFTGADMIRFFDSIIGKIQPRGVGKPVPNLDVVRVAFKILINYGVFRWSKQDGFDITAHDGAKFKAFTTKAVKDKRLIKGSWNQRVWTGFATLSRLVRTFLDHFVRHGTWSFDVVIARCLSIVLVSSLGCRSGDAAISIKYTGPEFVHYKHIELYLEGVGAGAEPRFQDLRAVVTLDYCKGHKDEHNVSLVRHLRPLDIQSIHVCPLALLLIHALRHGLVHGTTLGEVLAHAAARADLRVEWKYPERPVLAAFARGPTRCDLDTVAGTRQVLETMKLAGLVSGMLSRAYAHSLRLGAIRDFAHLRRDAAQASLPSTDEARRFAGHSFKSMHQGLTEQYAGDTSVDFYTARAEEGGVNHGREPKFAVGGGGEAYWDMVQKPLQADEIQAYVDEHMPGRDPVSLTRPERRTMGERVRRMRVGALDAEPARPRTASNTAADRRGGPSSSSSSPPAPPAPPAPLSLRHSAPRAPLSVSPQQQPRPSPGSDMPPPAGTTATSASNHPRLLLDTDPDLLDEEALAAVKVADSDVGALQDVIMLGGRGAEEGDGGAEDQVGLEEEDVVSDPTAAAARGDDDIIIEEAAHLLLGQQEEEPGGWTASKGHAGWIDGYAKYNVVMNQKFSSNWKQFSEGQQTFEDSIGHHSVRGGSRDEPTPYVFHCRRNEGCDYSTIHKPNLDAHELGCSAQRVELRAKAQEEDPVSDADVLKCAHAGCAFQTSGGKKALNRHVRNKHEYTPRTCEDCNDGVIYQTFNMLERHRKMAHGNGRYPSRCLFPGCTESREFIDQDALVRHLRKVHGLSTAATYADYLPPHPEKGQWVKQKCVVPTCTNTTLFVKKDGMIAHMTKKHGMDYTEAKEMVNREAHMEMVVPKARVLGTADSNKRPGNYQASLVASGKETDPPVDLDSVQGQPSVHGITGAGPKPKKPRVKKS